MRNVYIPTIYVNSNVSIASQLKGALRGQWVFVNGMMARVVNNTEKNVALWINSDKMIAVFK